MYYAVLGFFVSFFLFILEIIYMQVSMFPV